MDDSDVYKLVLFDFDGVLFDSNEVAHQIVVDLAPRFGFKAPVREEVRSTESRESVRKLGLGWFGLWRFLQHARREMTARSTTISPFPQIPETLAALRQKGVGLGVVSSNSEQNVRSLLGKNGLSEYFTVIECGGAYLGKHRKIQRAISIYRKSQVRDIQPHQVLYVGDETRDIEACRKLSIPIAAVSWGYHSSTLLKSWEPSFLLERPLEILDVVSGVS